MSNVERQELNRKRSTHLDHVFALRKPYEDSKVRCQTDRTFQSIIIDGADNQKCSCPHQWRYHVRREEKPDSAVEQKIETVIVHGTVTNFYVCPPFIPTGMNLTVSVLLDSLLDVPPEVEVLRIQFDGIPLFPLFYSICM